MLKLEFAASPLSTYYNGVRSNTGWVNSGAEKDF